VDRLRKEGGKKTNENEKITKGNVLELWANRIETVKTWFSHLQQKELNAYSLYRFCEWAKKTPDEILEEKRKNSSANVIEKLLDKFVTDPSFLNSFKYHVSIAVKSYCHWNYVDLAKASGQVVLEKKKEYNKLSKEGLRKLWMRARNPRDRALIPFVTSTGIAKETLSKLTWGLLEEDWETKDTPALDIPSALIKGHGVGRYKGVRQITFLTPEAKRELINYRDWLEQRLGRKLKPEDKIWYETKRHTKGSQLEPVTYDSFSTLVTRLAKDAGVKFTWHDGRRWLTTAVETIGLTPNWARVLRGRKVSGSENPYSRPAIEALRAKFLEAVSFLSFTSEAPTIPKEAQEEIARHEEEIRKLRRLYERQKRSKKKPEDCEDGEHCGEEFEQIPEAQLLAHLKNGWTIVKELSNGEVIVKR
jgi:hypothetical protein